MYSVGYVIHGWNLECLGLDPWEGMGNEKGAPCLMGAYSGNGEPPVVFGVCLRRFDECKPVILKDGRLVEPPSEEQTKRLVQARDQLLAELGEEDMSEQNREIARSRLNQPPGLFITWGSS